MVARQAKEFNSSSASIDGIQIPVGPRLGNQVVVASDLKKSFGDRLLIEAANFTIPAGSIVGAPACSVAVLCLTDCLTALACVTLAAVALAAIVVRST